MKTALFKLLDRFLGGALIALCAPFAARPPRRGVATPGRVLVVRLWTLGETLLTFPMISELRRRFPGARIAVLCRLANRKVLELHKDVDEILLFEPRALFPLFRRFRSFDVAIDTEPWFRVSSLLAFFLARERIGYSHGARRLLYTRRVRFDDRQYEAQTFLDLLAPFGIEARFAGFERPDVPAAEREAVERLLERHGMARGDRIVGICPGAEDALYRMWSAAGFAGLSDHLAEAHGVRVVLIGSRGERGLCERVRGMAREPGRIVNLAGETGVAGLFGLVGRMSLLVTNDTGPMHVAAVMGTRTVSLFGPNLPVRFAPRTPGSVAIFHGDEARPLINVHRGEIPGGRDRRYFEPIERITEEEVRRAADEVLGS